MCLQPWMIMVVKIKIKRIMKNQKGQAIFEMILFLPLLMFLYTIFYTTGNSMSGSINQQKATRGYFYSLVKQNSYVNRLVDLNSLNKNGIKMVGFNAIGWRDHDQGDTKSFAPCFKFSSLLKNGTTEECDSDQRDEAQSSRFVRVFTFYGVCGPTFSMGKDSVTGDTYITEPSAQAHFESCILSNN